MNKNKSKHILHLAKHGIVDIWQMKSLLDYQNGVEHRIGSLPLSLIKNCSTNEIQELTKETDKLFQKFSKNVSVIAVDTRIANKLNTLRFSKEIEKFQEELQETFKDPNIVVEYIGSGSFKHCFSIKFNTGYKYTIQTFHNHVPMRPDWMQHGMIFEPQNYFMVYKNYSHGRIARPFMSYTTTSEYLSGAYILTKYIDTSYPYKQNRGEFVYSRDKVISFDTNNPRNVKHGVIIDIGGFDYNPNYIQDPKLRNKRLEFAQILDNFDLHTYKNHKLFDTLLAEYKELGDKFFDTMKWPETIAKLPKRQREIAPRILRLLLHLRTKRIKMEQGGNYEQVRKLIEQDFINIFDGNPKYYVFIKPNFYPEIICEILGINTPELQKLNPIQPSKIELFLNKIKEKIK